MRIRTSTTLGFVAFERRVTERYSDDEAATRRALNMLRNTITIARRMAALERENDALRRRVAELEGRRAKPRALPAPASDYKHT